MREIVPALLVAALCGCTSVERRQQQQLPRPWRPSDQWRDQNHRELVIDGGAIDVAKQDGPDTWCVERARDASGAPWVPDQAALEKLSMRLGAPVRCGDAVVEHPIVRAVREAEQGDGFGDVLILVPQIMGDECPDDDVRAKLVAALIGRAELGPEAQLVLAKAIPEIHDTGSRFLLQKLAARSDVTEATLAACLRGVVDTSAQLARPILLRAVEHGLSPALRENFLAAARCLPDDQRVPLLEAFAKAPLEPEEQLALVKETPGLASRAARRVLVRLLASKDASDEAVLACIARAGELIEPDDEREVVVAAIATGRPSAVAASLKFARETHEAKTRSRIVESLVALPALDEASQLEVVSLLAATDGSVETTGALFSRLAHRRDATSRVKAAVIVVAPDEIGASIFERMKLDDDSALALVEGGLEKGRYALVADILKKHPCARVRDRVREAIDGLGEGTPRETLWRALVETTSGR